jgi:hypothetical protein
VVHDRVEIFNSYYKGEKEYRRRYGRRLRCERRRGKEGRLKDEDSEEIISL